MKERTGFYVNPTAREEYKRKAIEIKSRLACSEVIDLKFPLKNIPEDVTKICAVGGDGSIKFLTGELPQRERPFVLVVMPGGSQNGFYSSLKDAKSTVNEEQFLDKSFSHIPLFRPGSANGQIFTHMAGFGELENRYGFEFEKLRELKASRKLKSYFSMMKAGLKTLFSEGDTDPILDVAMLSAYVGSLKFLPDKKLYDNKIAHVSVKGGDRLSTAARLSLLLLMSMVRNRRALHLLAQIDYKDSFNIEKTGESDRINVDGEVLSISLKDGKILVGRSEKEIQVAAFSGK